MADAIEVTMSLVQRRNDMRTLLGARYTPAVEVARHVLRGVAAEGRLSLGQAAMQVANRMDAAGESPNIIFAALVDELEAHAKLPGDVPMEGR